ncbi:hypothetical protein BCV70DRAFT_200818 [Testicularia cyperi]|uniref:Uncharacterized protein n=1 Tax=Testicularia cyperi TaxID=1882483 RepID=A0A317XNR1_9BASI|nr:hypothetical protein BCV70DRAFT_200818 [Testicularia cyperi]
MLHSRGFVPTENQSPAMQNRLSPNRRGLTSGKRGLSHKGNLLGQEPGSVGPKQLFNELMSGQTPAKPLGDRNASKTPGPSCLPGKGPKDASPSKHGAVSPTKALGENGKNSGKSSEVSPRKAGTSNALRSLNGKQRQQSDLPFVKPGGSSTAEMPPAMTPAPAQLGQRLKTMSRQNSFVTPAANVGRAGQIKARMGEMMDAELGFSQSRVEPAPEQEVAQQIAELTEDELYPEIEYMPPSHYAKHPVFEFPDELDGLPRAKQIGEELRGFYPLELRCAGPEDLDDFGLEPFDLSQDPLDLAPPSSTTIPAVRGSDVQQLRPGGRPVTASTLRPGVRSAVTSTRSEASGSTLAARGTAARSVGAVAGRSTPAARSIRPPAASTSTATRAATTGASRSTALPAAKAAVPPVPRTASGSATSSSSRTGGLARSLAAPAPSRSRATASQAPSSTSTTSRSSTARMAASDTTRGIGSPETTSTGS